MMLRSYVLFRITSADVTNLINKISAAHIGLKDVELIDEITVRVLIAAQEQEPMRAFLEKADVQYQILWKSGIRFLLYRLLKRPVICIGIVVILLLTWILPGRVLFIRVEGNAYVPTNAILECAESCGITFGASTRTLRSERLKNALLERMNSLQWAAVNTRGCVATIRVREKAATPEKPFYNGDCSNIVAARDGLILNVVTTAGEQQCKIGQAVKTGQVLISGYVDCGKVLKVCQARGEVLAQTRHSLQVITPQNYTIRGDMTAKVLRYSIRIGKKLINLSPNGGISTHSCVKIYEEKALQLPGKNSLPVSLIKETLIFYDETQAVHTHATAHDWICGYASGYLTEKMVAGLVKSEELSFTCTEFGCKMEGSYICEEMIGRSAYDEN